MGSTHGSLAGDSPSIFVQNIYNDNRSVGVPPEIVKLLSTRGVIEVDPDYEEIAG